MKNLSFSLCFAGAVLGLAGCSDDSQPVGGSAPSGGGGSGGDDDGQGGTPQPSGGGGEGQGGGQGGEGGSGGSSVVCEPDDGTLLAASRLFLGDTEWTGVESATAWQSFGRVIDAVATSNDFSAHCLPAGGGSPANVFPDGPNGLDNSFGRTIIPILKSAAGSGVSEPATLSIQMGGSTLIFDLLDLTGADQSPVVTRLYGTSELGSAANFDGEDCWPVAENSLTDPLDITSAVTVFSDASIAADVWSSGSPTTIDVTFSAQGIGIPLRLYQAQIVMRLDAAHTSATQSQISGVIDTEEFLATIADAVGAFDPSLCNGAILTAIQNQIRQASDIMVDGTQDATATCNAISVGIGFEASAVHLGGVGPSVVPTDTCP